MNIFAFPILTAGLLTPNNFDAVVEETTALVATAETEQQQVSETPCSVSATACVDLNQGLAWIQDSDGHVVYGPVPASGGAPGQETPRGKQMVTRQVENEWSRPFNAPMPYATYFGFDGVDDGIAFHADQVGVLSAGCIHLNYDDAAAFFEHLHLGDVVEVL